MYQYISIFIFIIFTTGIQNLNGNNLSDKVVNINDKDLEYFDILKIIIDKNISVNEQNKNIVVYINEKIFSVDFSNNRLSFSLKSLRPTINNNNGISSKFGNKVVVLKNKNLPNFDLLNITINKDINGVRSEKIIQIYVYDKIVGIDTRRNRIDLYVKYQQDENKEKFLKRFPIIDFDNSVGEIQVQMAGTQITKSFINENESKNGNNCNIKRANGFIILCFILWHLIA